MKRGKINYTIDNFDVSGLPDYVAENREILIQQIALQSPTIDRIAIMSDVKGSVNLNYLSTQTAIQNGRGCGFTPSGDVALSDRTISTVLLKKDIQICADNLIGKWPEYLVRIPEDRRQDLPFEAFILASIIEETNEQMEELIWQGDTLSLTPALAWFDGFLKIAGAEAGTVDVSVDAGATAWQALRKVIAAIPPKLLKLKPAIHVSPEFFLALSFETLDKNLFHYQGNDDIAKDSFIFPGTQLEVVSTPGLSGTLYIYVSPEDNMFYATDVKDAYRRSKVGYNEENDYFYIKFRWNAGVQVAFPDRVVLGELAENPDAATADSSVAKSLEKIASAIVEVPDNGNAMNTSEVGGD